MTWAYPDLLWLLAAVAALALLRWWWGRHVRRKLASIGVGLDRLTLSVGRRREALRAVLLWLGLALGVAALAGPRWGVGEERQSATGADVLVVFDCSRSMLATDLYPNRLETARRKCLDLMRLAPETRLALMPFAAMPVLRCPLSGDRNALEEMLKDCHPDLFPADQGFQGTAIGTAVQEGLKVLDRQVERGQAILVLSDGADDDAEAVKAAAAAAKAAGVPVYGLFFGDPGKEVTLAIDGRDQVMKASRATLDELATATGALCVDARNDDQDITLVHDHLRKHVAQAPWEENRRIVQSERYQWLLLPGLVLIFLGAMMPTRRRRAV